MSNHDNVALAREYIAAVAAGATGDALARFFAPDVVAEEFPNRLTTKGMRRNLDQLKEASERGQQVTSSQSWDVLNVVAQGAEVALEIDWSCTLAIPVGTLPAGGRMHARIGCFITYRDGLIVSQRNYDCYDPW